MAENQVINGTPPLVEGAFAPDESADNLVDLLQQRSRDFRDRTAFTFLGEDGEETAMTFGQLDSRARSIAASLSHIANPGDRVLLVYPAGLEFIVGFFGCVYAGVLGVPATYPKPRRPMPRLAAIAGDCRATAALTTSQTLATLDMQRTSPELSALNWLATDTLDDEAASEWAHPAVSADDLAFLQYTSGSTSDPKGVMVSHANLMHNLEMIRQGFHLRWPKPGVEYSNGVFWLPAYHDMGLIGGILETVYVAGHSVLMPPASFLQRPIRWLRLVSKYKATISGAPNFAYELCVTKTTDEQRAALDLSNWRLAFCGAEPIRAETLQRFAEVFEASGFRSDAYYPCYGLAEGTLIAAGGNGPAPLVVKRVKRAALAEHRVINVNGCEPDQAQTLVGCGHALLDQEIAIADPETARRCGPDRVGEIWIKGRSVAKGYWNQPEENERTFGAKLAGTDDDGYLRTGDLGFLSDGQLFVTGRVKDVIIIRGSNHYPQDIERTVEAADAAFCNGAGAAFSITADGQERLVVIHEIDRQHRKADFEQIIRRVRRAISVEHELEVYAVVLIRQASLPRTTSGKVQRALCRQQFLDDELKVLAQWKKAARVATQLDHHKPGPNGKRPPGRNGNAAGGNGQANRHTESPGGSVSHRLRGADRQRLDRIRLPERALTSEEIDRLSERIESWLIDWLVERAGVAREEIQRDRPFAEYGLDSLTAVELSQELEDWLDVRVTAVVAWNYPTPQTLSQYLARQAAGVEEEALDESDANAEALHNDFEKLLAEIESLSDQEAEAVLRRDFSDKPT